MIPTPPQPKYTPGTRLRVTQYVRVGHRRWLTQVEGVVEGEGRRPVGGIEMGGKASYCQQETLRLRRDDGEIGPDLRRRGAVHLTILFWIDRREGNARDLAARIRRRDPLLREEPGRRMQGGRECNHNDGSDAAHLF